MPAPTLRFSSAVEYPVVGTSIARPNNNYSFCFTSNNLVDCNFLLSNSSNIPKQILLCKTCQVSIPILIISPNFVRGVKLITT